MLTFQTAILCLTGTAEPYSAFSILLKMAVVHVGGEGFYLFIYLFLLKYS